MGHLDGPCGYFERKAAKPMASVYKRGSKKSKRGGTKNRKGNWLIDYVDHNGKTRTKSSRTTDKAAADRIASKLEADAALRREGVIDPTLDAVSKEGRRTIESLLKDFENMLRAKKNGDKHIKSTVRCIREIAESEGFVTARDINADSVNNYAAQLHRDGLSSRTVQAHLGAMKHFTLWLDKHHKLPRNPLSSVKKPNPKADRRYERRLFLPEEWRWLEMATINGPARYGIDPEDRRLLYTAALQTGLRSNELRETSRGRLYLTVSAPYITAKPRSTKDRKDARQYIQPKLATDLAARVRDKSPGSPVFPMPDESDVAQMLQKDLREARRLWIEDLTGDAEERERRSDSDFLAAKNEDGEVMDFHALRHACGAWLAMAGVHPNVIKKIMRHSTITLTMDTYGHLFPEQESEAVIRLRDVFEPTPKEERFKVVDDTDDHEAGAQ